MLGGLGRNVEKASMTIEYIILMVCSILMYTAIAQTQRSKKKKKFCEDTCLCCSYSCYAMMIRYGISCHMIFIILQDAQGLN